MQARLRSPYVSSRRRESTKLCWDFAVYITAIIMMSITILFRKGHSVPKEDIRSSFVIVQSNVDQHYDVGPLCDVNYDFVNDRGPM